MYDDSDRSYDCPADGNGWNLPGDVTDIEECCYCDERGSPCGCSENDKPESSPKRQGSEWDDSKLELLDMHHAYARMVLKHLCNSEGAATVFAWPKDSKTIRLEETIGRGLHNHLNHVHFGFENDPVQRQFQGNPLAERLEYVLTQQAPFPGETTDIEEVRSIEHFVPYCISNHSHLLIDSVYEDRELQIPT
ncbi:hypothetical protein GGU10DRAFT_337560 [Lentinula aff. detonsa]|uniref:Uncharacterized protein n=1 Tax=Lentinula aff. detonsa TaxID=2804958 RepID=A0AA38L1L9_9AGAR|nr:hypothetical protein GGU10DRAFT_337560 [Lentinula aff. detonsa]